MAHCTVLQNLVAVEAFLFETFLKPPTPKLKTKVLKSAKETRKYIKFKKKRTHKQNTYTNKFDKQNTSSMIVLTSI